MIDRLESIPKLSNLAPKPEWDPALTSARLLLCLRMLSTGGNNLMHESQEAVKFIIFHLTNVYKKIYKDVDTRATVKIAKMTKREYAYHQIRDAITFGQFKPGERLIENNLREIFKCGRTPIREALSQLNIEGYLDFVPNKGLAITKMSAQDVKEIYEVIAGLEGIAVQMAVKNLNNRDREKIELIHYDLEKACNSENPKKWMDKNSIFHEYLVTASGNKFLCSLIKSLRNRIYRYRLISLTMPNSLKIYLSAHEEILKSILKKDGKKAGRAMHLHVLAVANNLIQFLNQIQEF